MNRPPAEPAGPEGMPEPPPEILAAARRAPEHWLHLTDPAWSGEGPPPDWAVVGRWRTGRDGEIEEWEENELYRPSPEALGWPQPLGPLDGAVQLAATGYGPEDEVPLALAASDVAVLLGADGAPRVTTTPEGTFAVPVTSYAPDGRSGELPAHVVVRAAELLELLDGRAESGELLYLSPTAPVSMVVEAAALREAVRRVANGPAAAAIGS
ncbi:type VII secretion system-associated protein [Streptomyces sp. NPDC002659]|uniref:type VII secretion system-associated protein n=1 Tax=Streptomyces sp. NPDC002659 TaxID=3364656 RepID=UPI00368B15D0